MRADKLKKMQMPGKPMGENEADQDLESLLNGMDSGAAEGSPEEEAGESPDEESAEMDQGEGDDMSHISDDDLLAELKHRGLMSKASPVGKAAESDIMGKDRAMEDSEEGSLDEEMAESPEEQDMEAEQGIEKHPALAKKAKMMQMKKMKK